MKNLIKLSIFILLIAIYFSCSEDDEMNPSKGIRYTFIQFGEDQSVLENKGPQEIIIPFTQSAYSSGEIQLKLNTEEEVNFQTIPEMINGIITLQVNEGDQNASFTVIPSNDDLVNGYQEFTFIVNLLSDNFRNIYNKNLIIGLHDDELSGMPRLYKINYNQGTFSEEYFYNSDKQLAKIIKMTQGDWVYSETIRFFYDDASNLTKTISTTSFEESEPGNEMETLFYWENDLIVKAEMIFNGIIGNYNLYEYDENRNLIIKTLYSLQDNDEYIKTLKSVYSYNEEGNIIEEKSTYYLYYEDDVEWNIITSYEDYLDKLNPFPVIDIIPGITVQKNLPGVKIYDAGEGVSIYNYTYEFDEEGRVIKRSAFNETTFYFYH